MFIEISGFLFLFIIVVVVSATSKYGYEIFSELDAEGQLQRIAENPRKFRTGTGLVVIEHTAIVALSITLFIAFGSYNIILGVAWLVSRGLEGLIQIYNKKNYWGLLDIAGKYSQANDAEKETFSELSLGILKSKNSTFVFAQILFSVGTLSYSILFAISGVIPVIIGWFGIVASSIYGIGNAMARVRPDFKALWNVGGLLIWIFELILGGWLLVTPFIIP